VVLVLEACNQLVNDVDAKSNGTEIGEPPVMVNAFTEPAVVMEVPLASLSVIVAVL
jgi:hypothetical protein